MKDSVEHAQLQEAVNQTVAKHPYFGGSIIEEKGDFYFTDNERMIQVKETKELRILGN
ncbi:MAG: hypothetical protein ACRDBO_17845 [Lachnospiraceae bacterium]